MLTLIGVSDKLRIRKCSFSFKRYLVRSVMQKPKCIHQMIDINAACNMLNEIARKILILDRCDPLELEENTNQQKIASVKIHKTFEFSTSQFVHKPLEGVSS